MCDGVGYCDPHQGFTTFESPVFDGGNGRMNECFSGIWRDFFIIETPMSVYSRREVRNVLRWQVSTQPETMTPTFMFISPRDCEVVQKSVAVCVKCGSSTGTVAERAL